MDKRSIQGGVHILLVARAAKTRDRCQPDGPLGLYHTMEGFWSSCFIKNRIMKSHSVSISCNK